MDLSIKTQEGRLNIRVAAVVVHGDKVLFETSYNNQFFVCPGGRIKFNESAEEAIARELREELGVDLKIERCLFVHQNFFDWIPGQPCHELGFYFLATAPDSLAEKEIFPTKDGDSSFVWMSVERAKKERILPLFVQKSLGDLPTQLQIVCERD